MDWGGAGRPVVLLAGLGNTAHIFEKFALKLTPTYHVYGITRRGFGASDAPKPDASEYSAERLGTDIQEVCLALKLTKPVLIGHSMAGEELSFIGSRFPDSVSGLVYLDAGYSYALYDSSRGDLLIDSIGVEAKLKALRPGAETADTNRTIDELLQTDLPQLEKDLKEKQKENAATPDALLKAQSSWQMPPAAYAITAGEQRFTKIGAVPTLAIYAVHHDLGPVIAGDPAKRDAYEKRDVETTGAQADAFETAVPSPRVVRLHHANHFVFLSNEADVLHEIESFVQTLPR